MIYGPEQRHLAQNFINDLGQIPKPVPIAVAKDHPELLRQRVLVFGGVSFVCPFGVPVEQFAKGGDVQSLQGHGESLFAKKTSG